MLNNRSTKILQELMAADHPLTSDHLALTNQVSSRTVRNDIKTLDKTLSENGARVESIMGKGYHLNILDQEKLRQFLKDNFENEMIKMDVKPTEPEDRVKYLIKRLLLSDEYLKLEELADELYISYSTIKNDIRDVKAILAKYGIKIEKRPNYGIKLNSNEVQQRFCMSDYIFSRGFTELEIINADISILPKKDIEKIQQIILKQVNENQIAFSDIGLKNLVIHIAIACKRIQEQNYVSIYPEDLKSIVNQFEYEVAKRIVAQIQEELKLNFPDIEVAYIAIHLLGTKLMTNLQEQDKGIQSIIDQKVQKLTDQILETIENELNLGISTDKELIHGMCLHLKPAINRYRFGMNIRNPMIDNIKTKYPLAFEAGVLAQAVIEDRYRVVIDENEIGYLALHIGAALERKKLNKQRKRCMIVCASGVGSAQLLYYNLQAKYGNQLEIKGTTDYYRLKQIDFNELDFIISTIQIMDQLPVPVIQISCIPEEQDLLRIEKNIIDTEEWEFEEYMNENLVFLQQTLESKEDVIRFLGKELLAQGLINDTFIESVFRREEASPTSFGNLVAIPHPDWPQTEHTFWAICTLRKPIIWADKRVQFVCLLSVKKKNTEDLKNMYSILGNIINNADVIQQLIKCAAFDEFQKVICNMK